MHKWLAPVVAILSQGLAVRGAVGPFVFADELGYIAAARYFEPGGQDVQMLSAFYHFGYGLVLAPLALAFDEPAAFYRAGTILNGALIVFATLLFERVILRRFFEIPAKTASLAAVGFALAPSVLVNSSILWAESALVLMITVVLGSLLSFARSPDIGRAVLVGLSGAAAYAMHPRAIAVMAAAVGAVGVASAFRRIPAGLAALTVAVAVIGLFTVRAINRSLEAAVYTEGSVSQSAGGISTLIRDDPLHWLGGLLGTGWYQLLASAGLVGFGVARWATDLWASRRGDLPVPTVGSLFLLAALGLSWLFGAVIAIGDEARIDQLLYGRYLDVFAPFAIGFGVVFLGRRPSHMMTGGFAGLIALLGLALSAIHGSGFAAREVVRVNIPVASALEHLTGSWSLIGVGLISGAFAVVISYGLRWRPEVGVACLAVFSLLGAGTALRQDVYPASQASRDLQGLAETTESLADNGTVFLTGPYEVWMLYGLQYWADDVQFELETHCPGASNDLLVTTPDDPRYLSWSYRMTDEAAERVFVSDPAGHASQSRSLSIEVHDVQSSPRGASDFDIEITIVNTDPRRELVISDPQVLGLFARWYGDDEILAATPIPAAITLEAGESETLTLGFVHPGLPAGDYELRVEPRADGWVWLTDTPCGRATAGSANLQLE